MGVKHVLMQIQHTANDNALEVKNKQSILLARAFPVKSWLIPPICKITKNLAERKDWMALARFNNYRFPNWGYENSLSLARSLSARSVRGGWAEAFTS